MSTVYIVELANENAEPVITQVVAVCSDKAALERYVKENYVNARRARCEHIAYDIMTPDGIHTDFLLLATETEVLE